MTKARKVLLIEDDGFTRFMMRQIISALDVDVDLAHDGQEGLSSCPKTHRPTG